MLPDRVSNPGPLTYESGALRIALRGPAVAIKSTFLGWVLTLKMGGGGGGHHHQNIISSLDCPKAYNAAIMGIKPKV